MSVLVSDFWRLVDFVADRIRHGGLSIACIDGLRANPGGDHIMAAILQRCAADAPLRRATQAHACGSWALTRNAVELAEGMTSHAIANDYVRLHRPAVETVTLADGKAAQALIPGVEPVSNLTRELRAEHAKRMAKRQHQPMQAGGLFDDVARAQQSLF